VLAHAFHFATKSVLSACGFSKKDAHQLGVLMAGCTVLVDPIGAVLIVSTEIVECNQAAQEAKSKS
jgi:hypothetical protein